MSFIRVRDNTYFSVEAIVEALFYNTRSGSFVKITLADDKTHVLSGDDAVKLKEAIESATLN